MLAGPRLDELTWRVLLIVPLALAVMRMLPVALSLIGGGLRRTTVLYFGWFGPRGLASILFALFPVEEAELPGTADLYLVVTWTVLLSELLLHGMSSVPLTRSYAEGTSAMFRAADMPESMVVLEHPASGTIGHGWQRRRGAGSTPARPS